MFLVQEVRRGKGVTVLSWDKAEVSRGGWEEVVNASFNLTLNAGLHIGSAYIR